MKKMGVWSIVRYQDFLKVTLKANLGSHYVNMKQSVIFVVTEPTLDAAAVPPHQLKNGGAPMMTWWLPGLSFSADTVLSAQHQQVCGKINIKLSTLGSVSS